GAGLSWDKAKPARETKTTPPMKIARLVFMLLISKRNALLFANLIYQGCRTISCVGKLPATAEYQEKCESEWFHGMVQFACRIADWVWGVGLSSNCGRFIQ